MSEQQQPKEHCEHEGWCWHQILGCIPLKDGKPKCVREGCSGDTRSRQHPAPALYQVTMKSEAEINADALNVAAYERGVKDGARKAREDECERIYGLFHEVERLHLNGMAYPDLYNEMVARIKFIHTEPLSKDWRKKESLRSTRSKEASGDDNIL